MPKNLSHIEETAQLIKFYFERQQAQITEPGGLAANTSSQGDFVARLRQIINKIAYVIILIKT